MSPQDGGWAGAAEPNLSHAWLQPTENLHVESTESLITPAELDAELPATKRSNEVVIEGRHTIDQILARTDQRLLVVVGPCSIHDEAAAIDYAERLAKLRRQVIDQLYLMMRVYFEKPRTTVGWKGLINDPHLNGSFDISEGLRRARRLLCKVTEMGLPTGTEMLDPITPQYIDDLVSWAAIGARTTESQTHRQMASGLSMPVGFKNSTEGNLQVAIDAMLAARSGHAFLGVDDDGRTSVIRTRGNPWGHAILRGGGGRSNFAENDVAEAAAMLESAGLAPNLMVDCSHANSGKKPEHQHVAWESVIGQRLAGNENLIGLMLESNLVAGRQSITDDPDHLAYGQSITDACIGWEETEQLVHWAHDQLKQR